MASVLFMTNLHSPVLQAVHDGGSFGPEVLYRVRRRRIAAGSHGPECEVHGVENEREKN